MLHMDLFGPTNVKSLMKKSYCLVVTDDFSRFSWVFFLATKDETSGILKTFITEIENQLDYKVKVIRSDNGTEFKNSVMNQFCEMKGIKREFSVARTPQQNGVAERRNRTLIEATRTMVKVIKPNSKTPYELIHRRTPLIDFMKPFGCPVTILNTRDHLGKFDGKADEGFFVGYSVVSKAMRVFNKRTRIVEETLNIRFLENAPNVKGNDSDGLFHVDSLSKSINYVPVDAGNQTNGIAGTRDNIVASQAEKKIEPEQDYILIPIYITDPLISQGPKDSEEDARMKPTEVDESEASDKYGKDEQDSRSEFERLLQQEKQTEHPNSTNSINTISTPVNVLNVSPMDDNTGIFAGAYDDEDVGGQANLNNFETTMNVWTLVDLPNGKRAIRTKWVFRNKKDERGIVVRNKARLVAQGYTQEEDINYDKVFAPIARIEASRLFLAYASYMGFIVYQMDVKSAFLYETIKEEVYVCQPPGFEDPYFLDKVYKVEKSLYGLHQAPRAWYETLSTYLLENGFRRGPLIRHYSSRRTRVTSYDAQEIPDEFYRGAYLLLRSMIGSLMYLTASRPDITFAIYACARFQVTPKTSNFHAMKRIFRYLKGHPKLGLWYPRDSPFDLEAFSDSDYASTSLDRKSTTGEEANYVNMQLRMVGRTCSIKRGQDTKIPQSGGPPVKVDNEAVHKELGDRIEMAATTASSLEAEQDSGNINRTQSMGTLNEPSP
ncbi:putative ribonuclease H-like domain-containing protein [Tanacetum coccineum]|uniref:Ribonuclease H-like domain-containing protein n=1 Tax=Tanacetum coccineum TaxID=301880 RepID=A0ABQ5EQH6_9ASTR